MNYEKSGKKLIIGLVILVLLACTLLYKGHIRFNYPSESKYTIRGIDVSHHQKVIDWKIVKEQRVKFAFIKATEGGDLKDQKFSQNWQDAKANNIDVGAYHFFTFCKSGSIQAKNFIETVPIERNSLPSVIDLEYGGNCKLTKTKDEILKEIKVFESEIFITYNKRPILYVTKEFYDDFLIGQFPNNPIWLRSIYFKPELKDNRKWLFWQYGNRGHIKGIQTYVDLNVFYGNEIEYDKLKKY